MNAALSTPRVYQPRTTFLSFSPPHITDDEINAVVEVLRSGWLSTGPRARELEQVFAERVGAEAALALNSCTAGLHLALVVAGVGAGDEVITTTMTFCSSAHVIEHVGAAAVIVDIDPVTMNIDPNAVERAITPRTRALLPIHLAGHPAEMDALYDIAHRHGLRVIEDAAHAMPSAYRGRAVGALGDLTAFSFYATKNMTTGEGGMLTGSRADIERARLLSLHGMDRDAWRRYEDSGSWYYEVVEAGFKYNLSDLQAALGLAQFRRLDAMQSRRAQIVARYDAAFAGSDTLEMPVRLPHVESALHLYIVRLNLERLTIDRARFIHELRQRNIGTSVHFIPLHLHPYYRDKYGLTPEQFPVAQREFQRTVSLPLYPGLTDKDVEDVIDAVNDVLARYAN